MSAPNSKCLVLVHGFLGASNNWLAVVSKLKARSELNGWDIYCPDLRWHSGDPTRFDVPGPNEKPPSTEAVAVALAKDLNQLAATEVLLVGHSFGLRPLVKILAQDLLVHKRALGLVAEDSSPVLSQHGTQMLEDILSKTPVPFATRELAREYFDTTFGPSSALSRFLLSNIREDTQRGGHTWRFASERLLALLRHSASESLQQEWCALDLPVAMMVGDRSPHLSHDQARAWQQMRTKLGKPTELIFIKDAGHWVHAEQSDQFVIELVGYLVKLVSIAK